MTTAPLAPSPRGRALPRPAIIISPDGTATLRPTIEAARAVLRPAKIAPGAVTDAGYLAWRDEMDASCPVRSLAVAAIAAALLDRGRA